MASEKIKNDQTHSLIEVAIPLLDQARAATAGMKAAPNAGGEALSASALSLAIQGLVMAHFIQFKTREVEGETAVEATLADFHAAFAGMGQAIGMCLTTLSSGTPLLNFDLTDTFMKAMAGAVVSRERR